MKKTALPENICSILIRDSYFGSNLSPTSVSEKLEALYEHLIQKRFTEHGIIVEPERRAILTITGLKNQPEEVMNTLLEVFRSVSLESFTWNDQADKPHTHTLKNVLA